MALIKKWHLKAVVQKTISFLPYRNKINYLFQKYVTKGVDLNEEHFGNKCQHLADHLSLFQEFSGSDMLNGKVCLELGTGWYPIIPIGYYLKGADHVYSVDISAHLTSATFCRCLAVIDQHQADFLAQIGPIQSDRWKRLQELTQTATAASTLTELCNAIHFEPIVADARKLSLADQSIQLVSSNNTFEHIYAEVLAGILKELWRVTATDGMMSHFIDMSDHFAHMDKDINIYNFLQFTENQWQLIDNRIQPQNRWRLTQHQELYRQLGIPYENRKIRPGDLEQLETVSLAAPFNKMSKEEVAISHGYLMSKRGK